jgi:hypothetical protein
MAILKFASILIPVLLGLGLFGTFIEKFSLDSSTIPTLVNGIASSTSIMVGFSGTIIALILGKADEEHHLPTWLHVAITFAILGLLSGALLLFWAYLSLATGEDVQALRFSLAGLECSFCTLFGLASIILEMLGF